MPEIDEEFPHIVGPITDFDDAPLSEENADGMVEAPLIPLRDLVIFPRMVTPLFVGRPRSLTALVAAEKLGSSIICVTQKNADSEEPQPAELYEIGVEVALGRTLHLPDGTTSALVRGVNRVQMMDVEKGDDYYRATVRRISEPATPLEEMEALQRTVLSLFEMCVDLNTSLPEDALIFAMNIDDPSWLADLIATTLNLSTEERQGLLETDNPAERLMRVSILLGKELNVLEIENRIHNRVQEEVDKNQREVFLREQMRAIQSELGETDIHQQEVSELRKRIEETALPSAVAAVANKEIKRLAGMPHMAPEVGVIRTYLDWLTDLPWEAETEDNLDTRHAAKVLDAEHYGLEKAKERILEYIAVRKLAPDDSRQPILCFVGPPGTGKTSLGKSIAKALGREFVRVSLGGVRDEAEIRGHRRTYIGAMPGRIIQTMQRAGTVNPVFMLDEIDKLGQDYRGDPSAALLEVLDPEQNYAFSDHYLEVDYDLSNVLFITTANTSGPIPPALEDRLEIIEFPGYIEEEKVEIAKRFLIPRQIAAHGIGEIGLGFETKAIQGIIREYTYEAGVRNLEREIATICRKVARRVAEDLGHRKRITPASLHTFLGPPQIPGPLIADQDEVGIATGVAWTEGGGDVLPVEVSLMAGKGNLTLTGQLGDIMQESAQAALSYIRARAKDMDINPELFDDLDIHIHLPEGSIPKDGPSAGVTLVTALMSGFTRRPVRHDVAMTGEITLRGRVLPVGGIKEKLMAAYRAGIMDVVIPADNEKDLVELPDKVRKTLNITLASRMDDVLIPALRDPIDDPDEFFGVSTDEENGE